MANSKKDLLKLIKSMDEEVIKSMVNDHLSKEDEGESQTETKTEEVEETPKSTETKEVKKEEVSDGITKEEYFTLNEKLDTVMKIFEKTQPFGIKKKVQETKSTDKEEYNIENVFANLKRIKRG